MTPIDQLQDIWTKWVQRFPGFWLSVLGLLFASGLVVNATLDHHNEVAQKRDAAKETTALRLSQHLTGAQSPEVSVLLLRTDLAHIVLSASQTMIGTSQLDNYMAGYKEVEGFIDSLKLEWLVATTRPADIDRISSDVANQIDRHLISKSNLLKNERIYLVWSVIALLYIGLVGTAYFANEVDPAKGEPVLNIVDLGLYLALVEISGGFDSPVMAALALSVLVAGLALIQAFRAPGGPPRGYWGEISPTVLYLFALGSGLYWATLAWMTEMKLGVGDYFILYLRALGYILLIGVGSLIAMVLLLKLFRNEDVIPGFGAWGGR
jgi:hypothetical protein